MSSAKIFFGILFLVWSNLWLPELSVANPASKSFAARYDMAGNPSADSTTVEKLLNRAYHLIEKDNSLQAEKEGLKIIDRAIEKARATGSLVKTGIRIDEMGVQMRNEARYPLAIRLHKKALAIGKETGNKKLTLIAYNNLGVVYRRIDNYKKAMECHFNALRLAVETGDSVSRAIAVNSIGNVYLMLGNYDKALEYFKQSLHLEQNRKNPIGIAINMNNIAHVYEAKGYLAKALKYYEFSLDINRKVNSKRGIAICSNNIAELLQKEGKYREALVYSKQALKLASQIKDNENLAYAYIITGALYSALKDYKKAFEYLAPGIELAKKIRARSTLEDGYNTLFNTYMAMKKYKEAIKYMILKQAYHDSLINLEVKKSIARLQIQFDTERQKNQMQMEQQKTKIAMLQLKKQKYLLYFAWSAFAFVLIVLSFVSFYLLSKNRQNKLLLEKTKAIETAEKKLKKSNKALKEAIKKAKDNARAKTDFLANISHEIRTPLNSVIGFSDLLFSMTTDEQQKNYLQTIKSSGESLLALINDILDLSKIEEGNIDLEFKETDIRRIIGDVLNIFSLEASTKGLHLISEVEENVPPYLIFEEARLRQILLNLVGNAVKFTQQGSITLHAYTLPEKTQESLTLIIEVSDTGPGIPYEEQQIIFKPFHQAQTEQKTYGTGLGLSIAQRMVNVMNGEIKLESAPGKGSRFTVIFHQVQTAGNTNKKQEETVTPENSNVKKCLFINEPHPLKKEILLMLSANGFQVEDVGLNLSKARNQIKNFRLVIFCCLRDEILSNTRNIFEKENLDNRHIFLILNISKEFAINPAKAVSIALYDRPEKEFMSELRKFIRQFEEDEKARQLFHPVSKTGDDLFFTKLQQIFEEDFSGAFHTKMFDKIALFIQKIRQLALTYHLQNLNTFALETDKYLKDFDIVSIEKQLRLFQKAYEITYSDR